MMMKCVGVLTTGAGTGEMEIHPARQGVPAHLKLRCEDEEIRDRV